MYVPRHNRLDDRDQLLAFIRRYSFGTLVTMLDGAPFATHLPFMVDVESGEFVLPTGPGWGIDVNEKAVRARPPKH